MDAMDSYYEQLKDCEKQVALKNVVFEVEYMTEANTHSLQLYDNLVPRLKEFHMTRYGYDQIHRARKIELEKEKNNYLKCMMEGYK